MTLKLDCMHFPGSRPCAPHKETGVKCDVCSHYAPIGFKVLIVKLGAPGDIVRTTPLLAELARVHPGCHVTWIANPEGVEVLDGAPHVDRVWTPSSTTNALLQAETFDLVLGLDNDLESATLVSLARSPEKRGFALDVRGFVNPLDRTAAHWLEMAAFDDRKRANTRTYQDILFEMCGFSFDPRTHRIRLPDFASEVSFAREFARQHGLEGRKVVGLNTGAGTRWPAKLWAKEQFVETAQRVSTELSWGVLLLGGPTEAERNQRIGAALEQRGTRFADGCSDNSIARFIALMDLCDVVVSGDTLAMHLAIGLEKPVVALFGPTSAAEIELYGKGVKLEPETGCSCFYRAVCSRSSSCIESIDVDRVVGAITAVLESS